MQSYEAMVKRLVKRGILPSQAEEIVASALASNNTLTDDFEIVEQAMVRQEAIEEARQWWIYAPQVPSEIKRMPEARDHDLTS